MGMRIIHDKGQHQTMRCQLGQTLVFLLPFFDVSSQRSHCNFPVSMYIHMYIYNYVYIYIYASLVCFDRALINPPNFCKRRAQLPRWDAAFSMRESAVNGDPT